MRLNQLEAVVLRGVNVVRDVVTVLKRNGSNQAIAGFPATLPSLRHPSLWSPTDTDFGPCYERPAYAGAGNGTASRAGRLGRLAGDFARRWQASAATRTALLCKQRPCPFGSMRDTLAGAMRRS
jgi:hypothetical protein